MSPAGSSVAEAGGIANADEAVDVAVDCLVGAESIVAALDRPDVFVDQISLSSVGMLQEAAS